MKITFTIEIDEGHSVTVSQKDERQEEPVKEVLVKEGPTLTRTWIGEGTPGRKGRGKYHMLKGTSEYPYCAAQIKDMLEKMSAPVATVGKALGMNPVTFRNLLRRDDRGFSEEDYNVIMKAIQQVRDDRNKNKEII